MVLSDIDFELASQSAADRAPVNRNRGRKKERVMEALAGRGDRIDPPATSFPLLRVRVISRVYRSVDKFAVQPFTSLTRRH